MAEYAVIPTRLGKEKLGNGKPLDLVKFELGGNEVERPNEDKTSVSNKVYEANINDIYYDKEFESVYIRCIISAKDGGFHVGEIGIYDKEGDMIFIGTVPYRYIPTIEEGSFEDVEYSLKIAINAAKLTLQLDPSVTLATKEYVDSKITGGEIIPRETEEPKENEIYIRNVKKPEYEYVVALEGDVEQDGTKFKMNPVSESKPINRIKIKITERSGTINLRTRDIDGKSYYTVHILYPDGTTNNQWGWISGDKEVNYPLKKGDKLIVSSFKALEVEFDKPEIVTLKDVMFENEALLTDLTDVYSEISAKTDLEVTMELFQIAGANYERLSSRVGSNMSLDTEDKTSIVNAINEVNAKLERILTRLEE